MNMEQNNYYTTETYTQSGQQYQQPQYQQYQQPQYQPQPAKKKSGSKIGTVLAIIAAVAVVGGSAGFGGAYMAADMIKSKAPDASVSDGETPADSSDSGSDKSDSDDGRPSGSGDIASALSAIAASGNAINRTDSVTPTGANGAYTAEELYAAVNDTIVFIKIYEDRSTSYSYDFYDYYFGYGGDSRDSGKDSEPVYVGSGSGIIFTEDGYVLTNAHVAEDAVKLEVVVNDYNDPSVTYTYDAEVIGSDTSTDIAVLKIARDEKFKAAKIGDSDTLRVGQDVCAIGNPGADSVFHHTMTKGIISGLDRTNVKKDGYSISSIQTDAAINYGNSGGGLFDMYGNVVGVVNAKIVASSYEGMGFALTINEAKPIMEDLLNYGYVKSRPVIGITTIELNEYRAERSGAKLASGLLVASINEDAPVAKSDLRVDDIITEVNGTEVKSLTDVQSIISKFKVGDTVTLTVARSKGGSKLEYLDIDIILAEKTKGE